MTTNFSIEKLPILTAGGGTEINLCIHHYHAAAAGEKVYIRRASRRRNGAMEFKAAA